MEANEYCYGLHPQANDQVPKIPLGEYLWTGPYIVVKTLPNNNYRKRKLQTNRTQILHRISLEPCQTRDRLPGIQVQAKDFQPDNLVEVLNTIAWQSVFEHFLISNNIPPNEAATIHPDKLACSEDTTEDIAPDIPIEYNPTEKRQNPEPNPNPEPSY